MTDQPPNNDPQQPQQPPQPPQEPQQPYPAPQPPYQEQPPQSPYGAPQQPYQQAPQPPYGAPQQAPQPPYGAPQQPYQAPYQPYQPYQTMPPQGPPSRTNWLGLSALIVGGLALIGAVIPFVNYIAWGIGLVGLILGIVALFLKGKAKGLAIAGTIVSFVAIVLSIVLAIVYTAGFVNAATDAVKDIESSYSAGISDEPERDVSIEYAVTGTATAASIVYSTFTDGTFGTEQKDSTALPFNEEVTGKTGGTWNYDSYSLIATNGAEDEGDISCSITVDGKVVDEETSTGAYATVSCSWSSFDDLEDSDGD